MSRKDYEAAAKAIAGALKILEGTHYNADERVLAITSKIAHDLAAHFAANNPRFDRERFLKANGVQS